MSKPRIVKLGPGKWQCTDALLARGGKSAKQAYDRWLYASLRQAISAQGVAPAAAPAPEPIPAAKPVRKNLPTPKVPATPARTVVPAALPTYPEATVRQVAGANPPAEYRPSSEWRRNAARAKAHQPKLYTPGGQQ